MDEVIQWADRLLPIFALYLIRIGTVVLMAPPLGDEGTPREARLALTLALASVAFASRGFGQSDLESGSFIVDAAREVGAGLWMGFVLRIFFQVTEMAGALIGFEMGLGFSAALDPISGQQNIVLATLYRLTTALLFLSSGALHVILFSLVRSFDILPPGHLSLASLSALSSQVGPLFALSFSMAIALVAPLIVVSFCLSAGIALLARVVQGFHVIEMGFPIRVLAGLGLIWLSIPFLGPGLRRVFELMNHALLSGLRGL